MSSSFLGRRVPHVLLIAVAAAALLAGAAACTDTGKASEEDLGSGNDTTTAADTGTSDTASPDADPVDTVDASDTHVGDTEVSDTADTADVPPDTADTSDVPVPPSCEPPLRLVPDTVSSAGGEFVVVEGHEFYIGALEWIMDIEGQVQLMPDYLFADNLGGPCQLVFRIPPLPAGDHPVTVYYGDPGHGMNPPPTDLVLHVTAATQHWQGGAACLVGNECSAGQHCEVGLDFCAWDDCGAAQCAGEGLVCDPLEGCIPQTPPCTQNSDCALLYTSCGCIAVHESDPRTTQPRPQITACELDGCQTCVTNSCDLDALWASCDTDTGRCFPQYPL